MDRLKTPLLCENVLDKREKSNMNHRNWMEMIGMYCGKCFCGKSYTKINPIKTSKKFKKLFFSKIPNDIFNWWANIKTNIEMNLLGEQQMLWHQTLLIDHEYMVCANKLTQK